MDKEEKEKDKEGKLPDKKNGDGDLNNKILIGNKKQQN